jgi:hypothetical protein
MGGVLTTSTIYLVFVWIAGWTGLRSLLYTNFLFFNSATYDSHDTPAPCSVAHL